MIFKDREDAGRKLISHLQEFAGKEDAIVLGLARGGVVVAYEIAQGLNLPLDVVVPRKIGAPGNSELAIGAIMENGESYFDDRIISYLSVPPHFIKLEVEQQKKEALRRINFFRGKNATLDIHEKTVILVDDGIATGSTMMAVVKWAKTSGAGQIVVAVPVASHESFNMIKPQVDKMVCLSVPDYFGAVGNFYETFEQTEDAEVIKLISKGGNK